MLKSQKSIFWFLPFHKRTTAANQSHLPPNNDLRVEKNENRKRWVWEKCLVVLMQDGIHFQSLKTDEDLISQDWSSLYVTASGHTRDLRSDMSDVMWGNNVKPYSDFLELVVLKLAISLQNSFSVVQGWPHKSSTISFTKIFFWHLTSKKHMKARLQIIKALLLESILYKKKMG